MRSFSPCAAVHSLAHDSLSMEIDSESLYLSSHPLVVLGPVNPEWARGVGRVTFGYFHLDQERRRRKERSGVKQ